MLLKRRACFELGQLLNVLEYLQRVLVVHHGVPWWPERHCVRAERLRGVHRVSCRGILGLARVDWCFGLHVRRRAVQAGSVNHLHKAQKKKNSVVFLQHLCIEQNSLGFHWPWRPHLALRCGSSRPVYHLCRTRRQTRPPSACERQTGPSWPCSSARLGTALGSASGFPPGRWER